MSIKELNKKRDRVRAAEPTHDDDELTAAQEYLFFISETLAEALAQSYFKRAKVKAQALARIKQSVDNMAMEVSANMDYSINKFR